MSSLDQLISESLSPHKETRVKAENSLRESAKHPGFILLLLQLVSNNAANLAVRQAAAVFFKNIVKAAWKPTEDEEDDSQGFVNADQERNTIKGVVISEQDRTTIKTNLVELMCTVPPQIQSQISESISIIATIDYPNKWDGLLPNLVQKFASPDTSVVNGVLKTADSIFKSFRDVQKSDALYADILYTLNIIQQPILQLFVQISQSVDSLANDAGQLKSKLETLRLITSIYHSLIYQDLPEYFEDNMIPWMEGFAKFLQYKNPLLVDDDEETEPSVLDKLQTYIVDTLQIYVSRDDEPFTETFLAQFTKLIWNLLTSTSVAIKHDQLVVVSMIYLKTLVGRQLYANLFNTDESTLPQIVSQIVIPNMMARESDEENFEHNPQEFILTELEGSDNESRRRGSRDLLRAMCRQFEAPTTKICTEHISSMIAEYKSDPLNKWRAKDTAIALMLGMSIRRDSSYGVSEVNDAVNVLDFFSSQILPELQDRDHSARPMVKATSLNFVCIFRNQFSRAELLILMPHLIHHLESPFVVVHSLAANTIEYLERSKEKDASGIAREKLLRSDLEQLLPPLFTALFRIVDNSALNENQYVMKCIMRTLDRAEDGVLAVRNIVFEKLFAALERVCKNPRDPGFNHNLFESIAILVKNVCSKDPSGVVEMEDKLFPPFESILGMQVLEFSPYVFQVLGQLLEYRTKESGLGQAYTSLFPLLLTASLWETSGNIPGLTRLLQAYLKHAGPELVSNNQLVPILGIFQKLVASKQTECSAFDLLSSLTQYVPQEGMAPYLKQVFQILMTRLQSTKSNNFPFLCARYFALFCGLYGGQKFTVVLNEIQPNLAMMLLIHQWLPRAEEAANNQLQAKTQVIGLTRFVCDNSLLADDSGKQIFSQTMLAIVTVLSSPTFSADTRDVSDDTPMVYDAKYSSLRYASKLPVDPFSHMGDPVDVFLSALKSLGDSYPGVIVPLIQETFGSDPKLAAGFQNMLQAKGVSLV